MGVFKDVAEGSTVFFNYYQIVCRQRDLQIVAVFFKKTKCKKK